MNLPKLAKIFTKYERDPMASMSISKKKNTHMMPGKDDIDAMFYDLIQNHSHPNEDGETMSLDGAALEILAYKLLVKEICRQQGPMTKAPYFMSANEAYHNFGIHMIHKVNDMIDRERDMRAMQNRLDKMSVVKSKK